MLSKAARRQRIRELLADNQVFSQEQLQGLLRARGANVTQATLSRDLRHLGVAKGPAGYRLANGLGGHGGGTVAGGAGELHRILPSVLLSAEAGGTLVVLRTQPAHANPLAIEMDRARLPQVLGTIAGDDTVFVATRTPAQARNLLRSLRRWAHWR
jgi:transcriptional regulator of arginine metabolism